MMDPTRRSGRFTPRSTARSLAVAGLVGIVVLACGRTEPAPGASPVSAARADGTASRDEDPYRVVADEDGVGHTTSVVVLEDATQLHTWWNDLGFSGSAPTFAPDREVMIAFTATYPSGCQYGFSRVEIDESGRTVEARYYGNEPTDSCAADENPFTTVIAIRRAALSPGTWTVQMSVGGTSDSFDVP